MGFAGWWVYMNSKSGFCGVKISRAFKNMVLSFVMIGGKAHVLHVVED